MEPKLKLADEVWVATALLHRDQPECSAFPGSKILRRAKQLHPNEPPRAGLNPHIYGHCVANAKPVSGRYRMLYREQSGSYRLFRDGDDFHPNRPRGRSTPDGESLPRKYRHLLDWYDSEYNKQSPLRPEDDPILALKGVGKELWRSLGGGDAFIKWLRSDEVIPAPWRSNRTARRLPGMRKPTSPGERQQTKRGEVVSAKYGSGFAAVRAGAFVRCRVSSSRIVWKVIRCCVSSEDSTKSTSKSGAEKSKRHGPEGLLPAARIWMTCEVRLIYSGL